MREIKFRAWDNTEKKFADDIQFFLSFDPDGTVNNNHGLGETEFNQYTGLKDKNGVEIYEGDIIVIKDDEEMLISNVFFFNGSFSYKDDTCEQFLCLINENCEVIGNIYENKELLND